MAHQRSEPLAVEAERPTSGKLARYMRRMPPVIHEPIEWTHICRDISKTQRLIARLDILVVCTFFVTMTAVGHAWVALFINPILAAGVIAGALTHNLYVSLAGLYAWSICYIVVNWRGLRELLTAASKEDLESAAIEEEIWCREGAENWSWRQRLASLRHFAAAHNGPWWCDLGVLRMVQFIGGATYMWVYLRTYRQTQSRSAALRAAATVHYHHNQKALRPLTITMVCLALLGCIEILILS